MKKLRHQLRNKPVELTPKQIEKLKAEATSKAAEVVNLIPLLVLKDKFGFGKVRLERYLKHYQEAVDSLNKGYLDLNDVQKVLLDEVKIAFYEGDGVAE